MDGTASEDRLYELIGRRVRERRERFEKTQDELAKQIHLTRTSVTNIERGRQKVPLHHLLRIANALDADLRDLIPDRAELDSRRMVPVTIDGEELQVPPEAASFIKRHIQGSEQPSEGTKDAPGSRRRATRPRSS